VTIEIVGASSSSFPHFYFKDDLKMAPLGCLKMGWYRCYKNQVGLPGHAAAQASWAREFLTLFSGHFCESLVQFFV